MNKLLCLTGNFCFEDPQRGLENRKELDRSTGGTTMLYIHLESRMDNFFCPLLVFPVMNFFFGFKCVFDRIWIYHLLSCLIILLHNIYSRCSPAASGADRFPDRWIKRAVRTGLYNIFLNIIYIIFMSPGSSMKHLFHPYI